MRAPLNLGIDFEAFIAALESITRSQSDERVVTSAVADCLSTLLASPFNLPAVVTRTHPDRYVMYPLHIDSQGRFSVAAAVWNVGQATPIHSHETWGVVGIYSGIEGETRYAKPLTDGKPVVATEAEREFGPGQVSVCCTKDDDVHMVRCVGDEPCIGLHIYGSDIGTLPRRTFNAETGEVKWFTSQWEPAIS